MKQALRIFFTYLGVMILSYTLVRYVPFSPDLSKWSFHSSELTVTTPEDTFALEPWLDTDSISEALQDTTANTDSVLTIWPIANKHLYCSSVFYNQLQEFRKKLTTAHQPGQGIRILHYGDSQIEGDRITAHLRELLQDEYGGSGAGLTSTIDPQQLNPSVWIASDGDWKQWLIYDRDRPTGYNAYGILGQVAVLPADSKGSFKLSRSPWAEAHASNYQSIKLFIGPLQDKLLIKGDIKGVNVIADTLLPSPSLSQINWEFEQLSPSLNLSFHCGSEVHILGCALDSIAGINVDNIAFRGQSTPLFQRTSKGIYQTMSEQLNIGMVLLQFGTNMVPTVTSDYTFYKSILSRQFGLLKQYLPNVPVLFIGIADAAHLENGVVTSYEHLIHLRDAQKEIALAHGFGFFDLYEAMGGAGSIIRWSEETPAHALTDYVHFTRLGGNRAATMIYQALDHQLKHPDTLMVSSENNIDSVVWNR